MKGLGAKLSIIALVYVIEGFPMGVFAKVVPVFLRDQGVSLAAIGALSWLSIAWSAKVLWSPLVDRFGERRSWITGSMATMAALLAALTPGSPDALSVALWTVLALYCIASATQDVAIDAYTIALVDPGEEGPANAARVIAYRVGLIAAGGGLLLLPRHVGWDGTFWAAAGLSAAMALVVRTCPARRVSREAQADTWGALRGWWSRRHVLAVALFILLYRVGDRAMGPMVEPFWVDRGFTLEQIGLVSNTIGPIATMAGAIAGGAWVARWGIGSGLWALGAFALLSNLGYAVAAALPEAGPLPVYAASVIESTCSGLAGVAFMSFLMRICDRDHAAVQYAAVTAIYALAGSIVAGFSGWLTEAMGYAAYFTLTAAFALPAFAFLPRAQRWLAVPDTTPAA